MATIQAGDGRAVPGDLKMLQLLKKLVGMPVSAADYLRRGDWHVDAGDRATAIGDYRRAHELAPSDPAVLCRLAEALLDSDQHAESIALCDQAIGFDARCAQAYYVRGAAWRNHGNQQQAVADLRQAVRLNADHANARAVLKTLEDIAASREAP